MLPALGPLSLSDLFAVGSTLAYALKALHGAMKYKTGWEPITEIFLTTCLFPNMNSPNINVQKRFDPLEAQTND
jgi:hypothetical protein